MVNMMAAKLKVCYSISTNWKKSINQIGVLTSDQQLRSALMKRIIMAWHQFGPPMC